MVRFLAEIAKRFEVTIYPTPSTKFSKNHNIYELNIDKHPTESYWLDWGGWYDTFAGTQIMLYYEGFLIRVYSEKELIEISNSLLLVDRMVYININRHPWLYPDYSTESEEVYPFLSSALNPDDPSNNIIREVIAPVRLEIPNFIVKLSDNIAGVSLNQGFTISLYNNDGYFDNDIEWNLFNTPLYVKKAVKENPNYEDFKTIRTGLVEDTRTGFDNFQVNVFDKFRAMNEPACKVVNRNDFLGITINDDAIGKSVPIVYGTKRVKLLKINDTQYIAAEFISNRLQVFNKDGDVISGTTFNQNGIITVPAGQEAEEAIITGYTNNRIGLIIKDLIINKTNISYINSNWNISEFENYANTSPFINITITSGDVKKAIQEILKNDMAFFIQQTDGKFTVRKYGNTYNIHNLESWVLTKNPEKSFDNQEDYFSSCVINYNFTDNDTYSSFLYSDRESIAENTYRKKARKTFDTDLVNIDDVRKLASLLTDRYLLSKQTIKLNVGVDTSGFELMDTVNIDLNINDRKFSKATKYIIKEINPSQDILILEEL